MCVSLLSIDDQEFAFPLVMFIIKQNEIHNSFFFKQMIRHNLSNLLQINI
jgi:hypothetical protein